MRIVLDETDFRRLSSAAQEEILGVLSDDGEAEVGRPAPAQEPLRWREPYELSEELAERLVASMKKEQRKRLALFAGRTGRVRIKEIMSVAGEEDLRGASAFQRDMTRRLRRIIDDPEHKAQLIQWDFESTKWDSSKTKIVDGVYFVSPVTAHSLRLVLGKRPAKKKTS
jgi:hypothetical protein